MPLFNSTSRLIVKAHTVEMFIVVLITLFEGHSFIMITRIPTG